MSCDRNSNKTAARAAGAGGIPRLVNKKGFYLGAAAGGVIGGLILARKPLAQAVATCRARLRQVYRRLARPTPPSPLVDPRQVPEMAARQAIAPTPRDRLTENCVECGSSPRGKPGPWYVIDGKSYCQDCAPRAAGAAGKGLQAPAGPRPATPVSFASSAPGTRVLVTPPPATGTRLPIQAGAGNTGEAQRAAPLDPNRRVETRLQRRRIMVRVGEERVLHVDNAFAVLAGTRNGVAAETGLGITPLLAVGDDGSIVADENHWILTHLATGMKLAGPYDSPAEAGQLASVLAQLDWTPADPAARFTSGQVARVRQTVQYYDEALKEARAAVEQGVTPEEDDREVLADEVLYDKVYSTGREHGFARGYDEGAEEALEELGLAQKARLPAEVEAEKEQEEKVEAEKEKLALLIPEDDEEQDYYDQLYQEAFEAGYGDGHSEGYQDVMDRFGSEAHGS